MPFLRTPKGTKLTFSPARLSSLLSLVYLEAMGDKTPRYRGDIQQHCQRIWKALEATFGNTETDEWPGSGIQREIDQELRDRAPMEVHEAFISLKINEFQDPVHKKAAPVKWDKFEPQPQETKKHIPLVDASAIDPVWAILKIRDKHAVEDIPSDTSERLSDRLGVVARFDSVKSSKTLAETNSMPVRRSQWIALFKSLPKRPIPWGAWEKHILASPPDQKNRTLHEWWMWWQKEIDASLETTPQLYELRRALTEQKRRGDICGQQWIDGTEVAPERPFRLANTSTGNTWYNRLAIEHLKQTFSSSFPHIEWDWNALQKALVPQRDALVDWKAWQHLDESACLKRLKGKTWSNGEKSSEDAIEMPQWAWMRTAMAMAVYDPEPGMRTSNAIALYNQISTLNLIPSSAAVREAGKSAPRFFEDHTWDVPDHYSAIQKVIYSAAVDTTWTGTSASSWAQVRSKNAPVRSGRRKSTGVNDFLRTIDSHLKAQGRTGTDRPVTAMLPIWHLDVEEFLSLRHENGQRLQPVLLVSDLFMQRVAENGNWILFDPHVYPEVLKPNGYQKAEQKIIERKKDHPHAHKIVAAEKLWKKVIVQVRLGSPFLSFVDCDQAFAPSVDLPLLHGLDGVGTFPLPPSLTSTTDPAQMQWPVMAININEMISEQGEPLLDKWRETITWGYWMAERMYDGCEHTLSDQTLRVRPLCLGAVGFYEAIRKAMLGNAQDETTLSTWVYRISEAWATLATVVDQVFCQKNGPAPIWGEAHMNMRPFHPLRGYERLKEQRKGGTGIQPMHEEMSDLFDQISAHRFSVRTVWAPFRQAATWAGVSPGGFGTLFPIEWVMDEHRVWRLSPTNYLLGEIENAEGQNYGAIFKHPENPGKWPAHVRQMCAPDMAEWKIRLKHASLVRPWIDQSVSLTLPAGIPVNQLSLLLQQAWWMGLSNVRFEDPFKKPDLGASDGEPLIGDLAGTGMDED